MQKTPTYEELMALYLKEKSKNETINKVLNEKEEIINRKIEIIEEKNNIIEEKDNIIEKKDNIIEKRDNELSELHRQIRIANLFIQELIKKVEDKDIKLKKQLEDRFGIKSDKAETIYTNEVEMFSSKKIGEKKKPGRKPGTKNADKFDLTKVEQKEEIIDLNDKVCDACGSDLVYTKDLISYKVDIIPAKIILTKCIVKQYKCPNCTESDIHEDINCFTNDSFLTPSLGAYIVNSKYNYALPLNRLETIMEQLGAPLTRQQICNYSIDVAEKLEPIYERLKYHLIHKNVGVLHADETTLRVLENKDRLKSYMWLYASTLYDHQIYIYEYQHSREAKHPKEFLKDYKGYLVCDDYPGYESIPNVVVARCWFHAKKRFSELVKTLTNDQRVISQAAKIELMISNMFHVEDTQCREKEFTPDQIQKARQKYLKPLMDEYFTYLEEIYPKTDPKSALGKAIHYSLNLKVDLQRCLEDGHIELTNNLSERSIKPFVILRKNCLFANTENGAEVSALLMSIVQTAKMNGIKPDEYIKYVLELIDNTKTSDIDRLLPFNKNLPDYLKYNRKSLD